MLDPSPGTVEQDRRSESRDVPSAATDSERLFVGRDSELAELRRGVVAARAGEGRTFLLAGEPGIGKTRLAWELGCEARAGGARVFWGRCWEAGGAPAYWPWVEVIRQIVLSPCAPNALDLGRRGVHLAQIVPELAERLGVADLPPPTPSDPDSARFLLFDAVGALLRVLAARGPLVIVVDDCHAADRASLLLLAFLARTLTDVGVLLVGTYRDHGGALAPGLGELVAELARHSQRLSLRGLAAVEVGRLIEHAAGWRPSPSLLSRIYGVTEGNPFFVDEIVRLLSAEGRLGDDGERTTALGIPEGVREAVRRRLTPLSGKSTDVLELAAVIGREFDVNVLRLALGMELLSVLEALEHPIRHGLVIELPTRRGRFQFRHALIREVLYDGLVPAVRLAMHARVGEALEKLTDADPDRYVAELAHHFLAAAPCANGDRFVEHGVRAARQAMARMAFEEAAALYERIIDALVYAPPDERRRCELLLAIGETKAWANDEAVSRVRLEQAAAIARRLDATDLFVEAALGVGAIEARKFTASSRCQAAPELLREALSRIPTHDTISQARIISRLALHSLSIGARSDALTLTEDAVATARQSGDLETLGQALTARHAVLFGPDHLEERRAIAAEMLALATKLDSRDFALRGQALRVTILFELGDLEGTDAALEAHGRLAVEAADPFERWANLVWRGARVLLAGRFAEAERYAEEAFELVRTVPGPHTAELYGPVSFAGQRILIEEGRDDRIADVETTTYYRSRFPEVSAWRIANLARLVRRGSVIETRRELDLIAAHDFTDFERNGTWLASMSYLAEAIELVGDEARAAILYPMLLPFAERNATISLIACRGSVARHLGLLASTLGRSDDAAKHFEAAIEMNRRMGARPQLALTCLDYARLLARQGTQDAKRAAEIVGEALQITSALGMSRVVERCAKLVSELGRATGNDAIRAPDDTIRLEKAGQFWILSHGDERVHLKDAKGLTYVAELLRHPDREIHALDLLALSGASGDASSRAGAPASGAPRIRRSYADDVLDRRARRAYQRRRGALAADLQAVECRGDPEQTLALREEITALDRELARAIGLGGRSRQASDTERARISVTRTIRLALTRIAEAAPVPGAHLARRIRTGTFCVYVREPRE